MNKYGFPNEYPEFATTIIDCKVNNIYYKYNNFFKNITTYNELTYITYILLCKMAHKYITLNMNGFDPNYENKYNYQKYGTMDYFIVN